MPTPKEFLQSCSTVVITGGSSGIGTSLIKAIDTVAPNLIICNLSRSEPNDFLGPNRHHFTCDLTSATALAQTAAGVERLCRDNPAQGRIVLINNSGFGDYGPFQELDGPRQLEMIDLNIRAMVDLTARLTPVLLERGGTIVNVASTAAFQPCPILATYAATKAFVLNWTLALDEDFRGTGVRALAVCPGPTATSFFKNAGFGDARVTNFGQTADAVAQESLRALAKGRTLVVTGFSNKLLSFIASKVPRVLITRLAAPILRRLRAKVSKVS